MAYANGIPSFIAAIPYYDKVGHFLLYGLLGYLFYRTSGRKFVWGMPATIVIFSIFTIMEEFMQILSANRTFSGEDLMFGLLGIWFFFILDLIFTKRHI